MKNRPYILFVAPTAYPICGAEGYVNAKLIKALSEEGFKIDLLSRGISRNVFYPTVWEDDFFFSRVNAKYVIPVDTHYDLKTIIRHVFAFCKTGYIYRGIDWVFPAIKKCEELISENKYDFIYTFDYPSEVVGLYLSKKYTIKWVSVWNDPYMLVKYPIPYGKGVKGKIPFFRKKLIKDIGKIVYKNIFPSSRLRDYMLTYMKNMDEKSCVICPHINLISLNKPNDKKLGNRLDILHSGNLGKERNPFSFCKGFALFLKKYPQARICVTFLGINGLGNSELQPLLDKYKLNDYFKVCPPVSYFDSLELIHKYDICMLIEAPCKEGIFLPSKIADYMQNHKPIWAISPKVGTLNDMYNEHCIDYFSDVESPEHICKTLSIIYEDYIKGKIGLDNIYYEKFSQETIVKTHVKNIVGVC